MSFMDLVGNDKVKEILQKTINSEHILHSYIFVGIEGIGKSLFAKEFAKGILCTNIENRPCEVCKSCIEVNTDNNPDFYVIEPEDGSIKIEQIRNLQTKVAEKPIISRRKVYIITNSELMTKEAQNCLLKTLEEPPEYITMILTTSNENLILNTIKSRCMKVNFSKIENSLLKEVLEKKFGIQNISDIMLETFEGSISRAIELKDKSNLYEQIENVLESMTKKDLVDILNSSKVIYNKEEILNILDYMNIYFYHKMKSTEEKLGYVSCISHVEKTKKNIKANANLDMSIDNLLMKVWEELN